MRLFNNKKKKINVIIFFTGYLRMTNKLQVEKMSFYAMANRWSAISCTYDFRPSKRADEPSNAN